MIRYPNGIVLLQATAQPTSEEVRVRHVLNALGKVLCYNASRLDETNLTGNAVLLKCDVIANVCGNETVGFVFEDKIMEIPAIQSQAEYESMLIEEDSAAKVAEESRKNANIQLQKLNDIRTKKDALKQAKLVSDIASRKAEDAAKALQELEGPAEEKKPKAVVKKPAVKKPEVKKVEVKKPEVKAVEVKKSEAKKVEDVKK